MPNLGERIYKLRSQNNMSQGELADALEVSRQAVSKWENNVSVPELDKIAAMSELFGVSTDVLIKGGEASESVSEPPPEQPPIIIEHTEGGFSGRKVTQILGIIFTVLGILLAAVMLVLTWEPLFVAIFVLLAINGVVLLAVKKHPWIALLIMNVIIVTGVYLVFFTNFPARQHTEVEELESIEVESIVVMPDESETAPPDPVTGTMR